ncbi:cell wall / vacuolar inhibitor of fructosidase 1-like [Euphorbia lathyris]|uniref:cell wall / vacuolar inhibitor of fructosidase 1-like n=1 Tax=Euphorbia lathyris TaxID=212925 RepID=UPI003313797F
MGSNQTCVTLFLLLILSRNLAQTDANIVDQTCKQTPHYHLCLKFLNSDPRSSTADVTGLALILVDLLKNETTKSVQFVKQLRGKRPDLEKPLKSCDSDYDAILTADVPEAIQALELGNPRFAEDGMNDVDIEATSCENEFGIEKSPLFDSNKLLTDISHVDSSIIRQLL